MSYSWSNPSSDEAEEAYSYYRSKYNQAADQKRASERAESSYYEQRSAAYSQMNSASSQKMNFEKRLEGIDEIIRIMDGSAFLFSLPDKISKAGRKLDQTERAYRMSIRLSGGVSAASLENAFNIKDVEQETYSNSALTAYRTERERLKQEIENLRRQIEQLALQISQLNSSIQYCNNLQASLQSQMNNCAYDMNHYRKFFD